MKKRYMALIISVLIIAIFNVKPTFAAQLNVILDHYDLVHFPDQEPYIDQNNKILVPIRFISEGLGGIVQWDSSGKQLIITYKGDQILLVPNSSQAVITRGTFKKQIDMGTAAVAKNGRLMVPLRFITETMGSSVIWVDSLQAVIIERVSPKMPDHTVLQKFKLSDSNWSEQLSKKKGYQMIRSWYEGEITRTSSGAFSDYITPITANNI
jgi:N-acetylmuramoyl-L-alanine amidase